MPRGFAPTIQQPQLSGHMLPTTLGRVILTPDDSIRRALNSGHYLMQKRFLLQSATHMQPLFGLCTTWLLALEESPTLVQADIDVDIYVDGRAPGCRISCAIQSSGSMLWGPRRQACDPAERLQTRAGPLTFCSVHYARDKIYAVTFCLPATPSPSPASWMAPSLATRIFVMDRIPPQVGPIPTPKAF
jgi:hypothetical protein